MSDDRPPKSSGKSKSAAAATFEGRLDRLRELVDELEGGKLSLEQAIERYEEGVRVLKSCASTLHDARQRVEQLSKDADGALQLMPASDLEPDEDEDEHA